MSKLGYNYEKITLLSNLYKDLYFHFLYSGSYSSLYLKMKIEHLYNNNIKIINLISNVSSPHIQKRYKHAFTEIFKFILPKKHYVIKNVNGNEFIQTDDTIKVSNIINEFKELLPELKIKKMKYKTIYILSNGNTLHITPETFSDIIFKLLKVDTSSDNKIIYNHKDLLEY